MIKRGKQIDNFYHYLSFFFRLLYNKNLKKKINERSYLFPRVYPASSTTNASFVPSSLFRYSTSRSSLYSGHRTFLEKFRVVSTRINTVLYRTCSLRCSGRTRTVEGPCSWCKQSVDTSSFLIRNQKKI